MNPEFQRNGKFNIPEALRLDHDELRAALAWATAEPGPIGKAATRVARLCLPHFEQEEKTVLPVFSLLHDLASGDVRPEMAALLPAISDFSAGRLDKQHQSIDAAIAALLQAARTEESEELAEFAHKLQVHERVEDEVVYPAVILIGKYLRGNLEHHSAQRSDESDRTWLGRGQQAGPDTNIDGRAGTLDAFLDELVGGSCHAPRRRRSPVRLLHAAQ